MGTPSDSSAAAYDKGGECREPQGVQLVRGAGNVGNETAGSMAVAAGGWGTAVSPLSLLRPLHTVDSGGGTAERAASRLHATALVSGRRRPQQ